VLAVLFVALPGDWVDVNVHPGKLEVRLRDQGLTPALSALLQQAFSDGSPIPQYPPVFSNAFNSKVRENWQDFYQTDPAAAARAPTGPEPLFTPAFQETAAASGHAGTLPPLRAIGQLGHMFILAEGSAGLYILDQHVVHERILYEQFERKHENGTLEAQMLLTPISLELTVMEEEILLNQLPLLEDFGIIIEPFGARHYLLRSVPEGLEKDPEIFFRDFLEALESEGNHKKPIEAKRELLISMSCKKAVKAHWTLTLAEMQSLIDQLRLTKFPLICPHGRPVIYELPYDQLLQIFGRQYKEGPNP
jgi:DNA mismatch repair protein MutL